MPRATNSSPFVVTSVPSASSSARIPCAIAHLRRASECTSRTSVQPAENACAARCIAFTSCRPCYTVCAMIRALSALLIALIAQQPGKIGEKASPDRKEKAAPPPAAAPPSPAPATQPALKQEAKPEQKVSVDQLLKTADEI